MKPPAKIISSILFILILQHFATAQTNNSGQVGKAGTGFTAGSTAFVNNGNFPKLYTCDSTGISPTLNWTGAPKGTEGFAVTMHHIAKDGDKHVYMLLYDVPATASGIPDNIKGAGKWGTNTINRQNNYAPPCSKGPGPKTYVITVYALSAGPAITVPPSQVNMDVLLNAIRDKIIASATINVIYSRPF